jgi:hypothetical protein
LDATRRDLFGVPVPVMRIRIVRMGMRQALMGVNMRMRHFSIPAVLMPMPVMLVMFMDVFVSQQIMVVQMNVALGQVQP